MTKRLVVFLHGLGGDAVGTWAQFPVLLRKEKDVTSRYGEIDSWQYATSALGATRSLSEIAHELTNFLNAKIASNAFDEIAFITHSQGGLLARRYLANVLLEPRHARKITPVFRLLTFATPHWGAVSEKAGALVPESRAQQKALAYDSDFILSLNNDWATADAEEKVWVRRVIATDDAVVPKFSALGASFQHDYVVVPGYGHKDIVKVSAATHPSFAIAKAFLLAPTTHQPALVNPDKTPPVLSARVHESDTVQGTGRFVYTTRYVPLVGREREMALLEGFLHTPAQENFAWMWVKAEGGVGKSRLALELCLAWQSDWHAGFLRTDADAPDWARWQPQLPTLIVLDYATTDIEKLHRLLHGLSDRDASRRLRRPVRLLLLDRHQQEDRLQQAIGNGSDALPINDCRRPDLDLETIDEPWAIIEHFLTRAHVALPNKAKTFASLSRVDPARRPLFAMLLADAIMQNTDVTSITRESLLGNVIARERDKYWRPAAKEHGILLAHAEHLLAFATMTNGLKVSDIQPPLPACDAYAWAPVFEAMAGYNRSEEAIAPLAPDLLGECFALQQFNSLSPEKRAAWLVFAWQRSPVDVFQFLDRVAQDFPTDAMLAATIDVAADGQFGRLVWASWIVNLVGRTGALDTSRSTHAFAALAALSAAHPNEDALRLEQAKAAFNLIVDLAPVDLVDAQRVFSELVALAAAHPNEDALRLRQAKAAFNLVHYLGPVDLAAAQRVFSELAALAATYPEDAALEEPLLRAVSIIGRASIERDLPFMQQIYKEFGQRYSDWIAAKDQRQASDG